MRMTPQISAYENLRTIFVFFSVALLAACGTTGVPADGLVVEFEQAGLARQQLDSAMLNGAVRIDVRGEGVEEVRFHLDDVGLEREPVHVERAAPFEFALDAGALEQGPHALTVVADSRTGTRIVTKEFFVGDVIAPSAPAGGDVAPVVPTTGPGFYDLPEATYYVSTTGSDGDDGRTPGTAFRTLQKAANTVRPGDTVYIRGGTYPIETKFRTSGTASAPITWSSYPGEWAVLDGSAQQVGSSKHRVWVFGSSHNHFRNFEVKNSPNQGIYLEDAHDNLFRNIVTHGNHGSGIQVRDGNRNRFEYVTSYGNYDHSSDRPGEDADGIGFHSGDGNTIYASIAYDNSDDGFDTWKSTNGVIDSSISHHNGYGEYGNGNGFKLGGDRATVHTVVKNSVAYANNANGFDYNSGRNVTFLNNTAFANDNRPFVADSSSTLRNNIGIGGETSLSGADSRNNTWDLGMGDPGFASTNPASSDFLTLAAGSPALTAGQDGTHLGALATGSTIATLVGSLDARLAAVVTAAR